jgi:hypothetical protein
VSSDFATSVGTLQLTPAYKHRCDGTLILEMPIIDSATYQWTSAGRILGNNRILEIRDTTAQTYSVQIATPDNCIKTVRRMRIYSRSGNLVFDKNDVSPHRGEDWGGFLSNNNLSHSLPSDVYVFRMEIELIDGLIKAVSGEITLLH